ncbi:MAG TPA: hypothetical protein VNR90_08410 [Vicinamibacterales bacterium]|nr:hypothetical protein [Vicinamibacterales bacterium]
MDPSLAPYFVWGAAVLALVIAGRWLLGTGTDDEYVGSSSPGAGAYGAVYDLLNQDKRNAIELIVEDRAAERDEEHADDTVDDDAPLPDPDTRRPR